MKEFWKSWKFWAIVAAVVLITVWAILYFTVQAVKVVTWEIAAGILLFVAGFFVGRYIDRVKTANK